MVSGVLVEAGMTLRYTVMFYKAVVQAVLLYRSKRWSITDTMMKLMEGFHH